MNDNIKPVVTLPLSEYLDTQKFCDELIHESAAFRQQTVELKREIDNLVLQNKELIVERDKLSVFVQSALRNGDIPVFSHRVLEGVIKERDVLKKSNEGLEFDLSVLKGRFNYQDSVCNQLKEQLTEKEKQFDDCYENNTYLRERVDYLQKLIDDRDATKSQMQKEITTLIEEKE